MKAKSFASGANGNPSGRGSTFEATRGRHDVRRGFRDPVHRFALLSQYEAEGLGGPHVWTQWEWRELGTSGSARVRSPSPEL